MKEAMFWQARGNKVVCSLCPHNCKIAEGEKGVCRVRQNIGRKLFTINYGKISAIALDPIEKKPLNNFFPGTRILSVGTFGCNFKCSFCQNWSIAHENPNIYNVQPEQLAEKAIDAKRQGNIGIAFTYNEPSIWFEFVYETAKLAKQKGLKNILVTNGYINQKPLEELLPYIDAMNIDVKAFNKYFYSKICKGRFEDVKRTVEISAESCHVEITMLVIPELNDSIEEAEELVMWLSKINPEIPLHISRFFPNYNMKNVKPTPISTIQEIKKVAEKHLKYVYLGNV